MHRTQLLLDDWQFDALTAKARRSGRSLSDLVREIVSAHLGEGTRTASSRLWEAEGVAEGPPDLGSRHDSYLYGSATSGESSPRRRRAPKRP